MKSHQRKLLLSLLPIPIAMIMKQLPVRVTIETEAQRKNKYYIRKINTFIKYRPPPHYMVFNDMGMPEPPSLVFIKGTSK